MGLYTVSVTNVSVTNTRTDSQWDQHDNFCHILKLYIVYEDIVYPIINQNKKGFYSVVFKSKIKSNVVTCTKYKKCRPEHVSKDFMTNKVWFYLIFDL
jgi:hypothetical protein